MTEAEVRAAFGKYYYRNFEITLDSGRRIWLAHFRQTQTYASVYEGIFWGKLHPDRVDVFRQNAEQVFKCPAILMDARPIPLPVPEEHLEAYCRPYRAMPLPFSEREVEPVSLGPITCTALFESHDIAGKKPKGDLSQLAMVWFQQQYAMPIDPIVLEKIKAFDWERHAVNWEL